LFQVKCHAGYAVEPAPLCASYQAEENQ